MMPARRWDSRLLFLGIAGGVLVALIAIVRSQAFLRHPETLGLAVAADLLFTLPLLYYLLLVRTRIARPITLILVFLAGITILRILLPQESHHLLSPLVYVSAPLEIASVGLLFFRIRRYFKEKAHTVTPVTGDWLERFQQGIKVVFPDNRLGDLVVTEISVFYYGICGWFLRPTPAPTGTVVSTCYQKSGWGALVVVLAFLVLVEGSVVHLLLAQHNSLAAWIWNAVDLYTILWLFADYHALRLRPLLLTDERLHVRLGLRWQGTVERNNIASIERFPADPPTIARTNSIKIAVACSPEFLIRLTRPVVFTGLLGITRPVSFIAISADDPELMKSLAARLPQ